MSDASALDEESKALPVEYNVEFPFIAGRRAFIPRNAPLRYRWWAGGQSAAETYAELLAMRRAARKLDRRIKSSRGGK